MASSAPVGVFDSGLGGISVLRALRATLPGEDYLYFGDSGHAPYGDKPLQEVQALSRKAVELLLSRGAKAIVIACNTATSAAATLLRERYPTVPIIGTEPALKPAVERHPGGHILVMATEMTIHEEKFHHLQEQFETKARVDSIPCPGLMEFVERGIFQGKEVEDYLRAHLSPHLHPSVDAVVLGCTHYPFLRGAIRQVVGEKPEILDGAAGIARQTRRRLLEQALANPREAGGQVTFLNSLDDPAIFARCETLLAL